MFKKVGITYRAILFIISIIFIISYFSLFAAHIISSIYNNIKFRFFSYKTIYIVTDLTIKDDNLFFLYTYINKQSNGKYKIKIVTKEACERNIMCNAKPGVVFSSKGKFVYNYRSKGFFPYTEYIERIIKENNCSIDENIAVLQGKDNKFYYYAVGTNAPFRSMLITLPIILVSHMKYSSYVLK